MRAELAMGEVVNEINDEIRKEGVMGDRAVEAVEAEEAVAAVGRNLEAEDVVDVRIEAVVISDH